MRRADSVQSPWGWARALGATLIGAVVLAACTAAPVQEMSDARQTIAAARAAGAARCAAAEEATVSARRWLENASYALSIHDYPMAQRSALHARHRAFEALIMLHAVAPRADTPARLLHACPPSKAVGDRKRRPRS